ncbi:MAG: hypothetical protein ACR2H1_01620, partial [Limisphaerales bacterium]
MQWARKDSAAALAFVKSLPEGMQKKNMWRTFISGLAYGDPRGAVDIAISSLTGAAQNEALGHVVSQWANSDLSAALT